MLIRLSHPQHDAGEYISSQCDGTGYEPSVCCTTCTDQCSYDDQYMRAEVVCSGKDTSDTRPQQACTQCTSSCTQGNYLRNRCMRVNKPASNTATCTLCSGCSNGQYISPPCSGLTTYDSRGCTSCRFGSANANNALVNGSYANRTCSTGSYVINECTSGLDTMDRSECSECPSNCNAANYSINEDGQYISELCTTSGRLGNTCSKCTGRCLSFAASPPGEYINGFCTGLTLLDKTCLQCRSRCDAGQYISGSRCNGETDADTTSCKPCTPKPANSSTTVFTLNPCTGTTTSDQNWTTCSLSCPAGQYVSRDCTETTPTECRACKTVCPAGYYLSGSCDGTTKYDTIQCIGCKDCLAGQYRGNLGTCNGSTAYDPIRCTACRENCSNGEYVFGLCSGLMDFDETSCKVRVCMHVRVFVFHLRCRQ
jgi:hypothetical protein